MTKRSPIGRGWDLLRSHKKAVVFFYLTNLLISSVLIFPFMEVFERSLGPGLYRQKMLEALDYDWLTLFQENAAGFAATFSPAVLGLSPFARHLEWVLDSGLSELPWTILALGAVYIVIHAFFAAAAIGSFAMDPAGTNIREFFRNGGQFFGRMFRNSLLALMVYWLLQQAIAGPFRMLVEYATRDAFSERSLFYWNVSRYIVLLFLFMFVNMVFDYSRIRTAVEDRTSVLLAFLSALAFSLKNFFSAYGLYLSITVLGVLWVLLYGGVEYLLPQASWVTILLAFVCQQIYIIGRLIVKVLFYSAQLHFLNDRR